MLKTILDYRLDFAFFAASSIVLMAAVHLHLFRHTTEKRGASKISWALLLAILLLSFTLTEKAVHTQKEGLQKTLQGFAPTYALEMMRSGHSRINVDTPANDPLYISLINTEKAWLNVNPAVNDIYTFGKNADGKVVLLVDSETDYDHNGRYEGEREKRTPIGEVYPEVSPAIMSAFAGRPSFEPEPYTDRWGTWVSAFEPLYDDSGRVSGVLGVDYLAHNWLVAIADDRRAKLAFMSILVIVLVAVSGVLSMTRSELARHERDAESIRQSEERFRVLSESAPVGIYLTDAAGNYLYTNKLWHKIAGMSLEESLGSGWAKAIHTEDRSKTLEAWADTVRYRSELSIEMRFLRSDGEIRWVDTHAVCLLGKNDACVGFVGTSQDITERKKMQAQLLQSQKMDTVGTLAGGIAHDLNNHMTPIMGYLDLLAMEISPSHPAYVMLLETKKAAQQCVEIVRRLLDFSRPAAQKKIPTDVKRLLTESHHMMSKFLPATIRLETATSPDVGTIYANETEIQSVLMNLAANVRDAMTSGGLFRIEASKTLVDGSDFVRFRISDTGCGIPPAILTKIYEPFFTTKPKGQGTGLGLAMVFATVMNHGGKIDVASEVGKGTVFDILLPSGSLNFSGSRLAPPPSLNTLPRGSGTVLIVDDEASLRELAKTLLEKIGYRVLVADDGEEALGIYRKEHERITAIVLDMTMPKMTGRQVLQGLLKINADARVVLVSGYTAEGTSDELIAAGASDFIQKPYTIESLAKALQRI